MSMMHARRSDVVLVVLMCSFFSGYPLRSGTSEEADETQICADTAQIAQGVEEQLMNGDTFTGHGAKERPTEVKFQELRKSDATVKEVLCGDLTRKPDCSQCGNSQSWCVGGCGDDCDCWWKGEVDSKGECKEKVSWRHNHQFLQYKGLWKLLQSQEAPETNKSFSWAGPKMTWMEDTAPNEFKNELIYEFTTLPWLGVRCRLELKLYKIRTTPPHKPERSTAVPFNYLFMRAGNLVFFTDPATEKWEYTHKKWFAKNTTNFTEKKVTVLFKPLPDGDILVTIAVGVDIAAVARDFDKDVDLFASGVEFVELTNIAGFDPASGNPLSTAA
mmetsp:Transcript_104921/g.182386  ORF Transcript_104921/g.182386 Transcript_104921/m.182386 type:complete len:330 (+) Transcript_104921:53-1042(+)